MTNETAPTLRHGAPAEPIAKGSSLPASSDMPADMPATSKPHVDPHVAAPAIDPPLPAVLKAAWQLTCDPQREYVADYLGLYLYVSTWNGGAWCACVERLRMASGETKTLLDDVTQPTRDLALIAAERAARRERKMRRHAELRAAGHTLTWKVRCRFTGLDAYEFDNKLVWSDYGAALTACQATEERDSANGKKQYPRSFYLKMCISPKRAAGKEAAT